MASPDKETHAFVLRFWREPRTLKGSEPIWRGVIEHVPSGQRRYEKDLNELMLFVIYHLQKIGVVLSWRRRLRVWWWSGSIDNSELPVKRNPQHNE